MYDKNDILARLQNGESADDIAAEMAEVLNAALATKRREDEEAAKANEIQKQKEQAADALVKQIVEFFTTYYAELVEDEEPLTGEIFIDLIDSIVSASKGIKELTGMFFPEVEKESGKADAPTGKKEHKLPVEFSVKKDCACPSEESIIGKFLKDFGLM